MAKQQSFCMLTQPLLFHWVEAELYTGSVWEAQGEPNHSLHTLLLVVEGQGMLEINNERMLLLPGTAYLIPPDNDFYIQSGIAASLHGYRLTFSAIEMRQSQPLLFTGELVTEGRKIMNHLPARMIRLAKLLTQEYKSGVDFESYQRQLYFQEIMTMLLQHSFQHESMKQNERIERTLSYIENHYTDRITVPELAMIAGIPHWQYTAEFQQVTGKKPLDYLNGLRIERSKGWLRNSRAPLREIAQRVGFRDEYYFNRRFRQLTGQTPRQYSLARTGSIRVRDWMGYSVEIPVRPERIVYHGETFGDLLVLGIEAVGGSVFWEQRSLIGDQLRNVVDVEFSINVAKLSELEPDLIILASSDEEQYNKAAGVAPTVTFDSFAPLEQRLYKLGDLLGIRTMAEQWLQVHEERTERMWQQLRDELAPGESASVFITDHGGRLFVMGTIGLPTLLYHKSGFQAPPSIAQLVSQGISYKEIFPEDLPDFAGDRIFMVLTTEAASRQAAYDLAGSKVWTDLPAVHRGYAYWVENCEWNYGDAFTSSHLLNKLPLLLQASS